MTVGELFLNLVNRSIAASWLVLAVLVLRLVLKKAPRWLHVVLWGLVAVRLLCPISIESGFSLVPSAQTLPPEIMTDHHPQISTGIPELNDVINPAFAQTFSPEPGDSANPLQILIPAASVLWLIGLAVLLGYTAVSYWHLRRQISTAVLLRDNVFQSEFVTSPFLLGIIRPRIYLPYGIGAEDIRHVIAHEQAHIRRRDHWWKPMGFLFLSLQWFNPLMWVAYLLLCRDIELACDEKVIRELGWEQRADYSQALVACSINRRSIAACPLAFGEVGVKARVKSVMHYKKPGFWVMLVALVLCAAVAVCFLTNPREPAEQMGVTYYYGTMVEQAAKPVPGNDSVMRTYILLQSDHGEEMLFWAEQSDLRFVVFPGDHIQLRVEKEEDTGLLIYTGVKSTDNSWATSREEAIEQAILDVNWYSRYKEMLQCADFVLLAEERDNQANTETYYGIALHQVFSLENGALEERGGSHIPVALTFFIDDSGRYILKEYWEPRDGAHNVGDIREKFPAFVWPDTQEHIQRQIQNNYVRAVEHFQLDTDSVIEGLLEDCTGEEIADSLSYRELLHYGRYTLEYCFRRFEGGNQTGQLGKLMSRVCKEILEIQGKAVPGKDLHGQDWYDAYADRTESPGTQQDWGVNLSVQNVTAEGATIVCSQSGGSFQRDSMFGSMHLLSGSHYWLEEKVDGEWVPVPLPQETVWTMEGWMIPFGDSVEWNTRWESLYGSLEPGQYRIGKTVTLSQTPGESLSQPHYAEFDIG